MKTLFSVCAADVCRQHVRPATEHPAGTPGQIKDELIRIEHEIGRANLQCDLPLF